LQTSNPELRNVAARLDAASRELLTETELAVCHANDISPSTFLVAKGKETTMPTDGTMADVRKAMARIDAGVGSQRENVYRFAAGIVKMNGAKPFVGTWHSDLNLSIPGLEPDPDPFGAGKPLSADDPRILGGGQAKKYNVGGATVTNDPDSTIEDRAASAKMTASEVEITKGLGLRPGQYMRAKSARRP
jgi:hypothetical protein